MLKELAAEAKKKQAKTLERRKAGLGGFLRAVSPGSMAMADKRIAEDKEKENQTAGKHGKKQRIKQEKK